MTNPITGVSTTSYRNPYMNWGLYNPTTVDMETTMATGYNPSSSLPGMDYGLFNSLGYSSPYSMGYDSFGYGSGMGYGMYGMGYGMYSPAMTQAMVQSQTMMMDGQKVINEKQREMNYSGQISDMNYQTKLKDARDTNHEDTVRRDTNFKNICEKINQRLEAKDTKAALEEYNYALSLMATVYDDVDDKRSPETPSRRAAVKAAFERKYQEVCGQSFKDKINECLPGEFGSGFQSVWRMQDIMSKEEMTSYVDDRNMAFKEEAKTYRAFGSVTAGVANTAVHTAGGAIVGGAVAATVGAFCKNAGKFGKWGAALGAAAGLVAGIYRSTNRSS